MKNYTFITGNEGKAREFNAMVGLDVPHKKVSVPEIQSMSIKEIAEAKAKSAFEVLGSPVIIEDVSLAMDALAGLPGPFVAFFLEKIGNNGLIEIAKKMGNSKAIASVCFGLYDGENFVAFENSIEGTIADRERGEFGFGWDTIFIPNGFNITWAEMTEEEKNATSMRKEPIARISNFLKE